jgi:hypothetical protein
VRLHTAHRLVVAPSSVKSISVTTTAAQYSRVTAACLRPPPPLVTLRAR